MQEAVKIFMRAMDQEVPLGPTIPKTKIQILRADLIWEELQELIELVGPPIDDTIPILVKFADCIADLLYVVHGAAIAHGIDINPIFKVVHNANMRKLGGPVAENGKRLKPPDWISPETQIRSIIIQQIENAASKKQRDGVNWEGPQ